MIPIQAICGYISTRNLVWMLTRSRAESHPRHKVSRTGGTQQLFRVESVERARPYPVIEEPNYYKAGGYRSFL